MKQFLQKILATYARLALILHKPKIIGITGSVGKSSTKEAIALVLSQKFSVRSTPGNLNSELGLPLAILGFRKAGGFKKNLFTVFGWLWILIAGFFKIFTLNYPKILVLEMGSDKPGDIKNLLQISGALKVAVITDIGISHMEFYSSADALAKEKLSILTGLEKTGFAIFNADNPKVLAGRTLTTQNLTYGFSDADIKAQDFQMTTRDGKFGTTFKVAYKGHVVPFFIPNTLGKPVVYSSLAAAAVGIGFRMNLVEISQALEKYKTPAGRLILIEGLKSSRIIDDTYNAAPASTIEALKALASLPSSRKLAAIGSMAELGTQSELGHREVAGKIAELGLDVVFLVGENAKIIQDELTKRNFPGLVSWFPDSESAVPTILENLREDDSILVKGSQSARMEKIVKKIMKNPSQAKDLLVRQSKEWLS